MGSLVLGLEDIIAILGMDELSEEDKLTVARARKATPDPNSQRGPRYCTEPRGLIGLLRLKSTFTSEESQGRFGAAVIRISNSPLATGQLVRSTAFDGFETG